MLQYRAEIKGNDCTEKELIETTVKIFLIILERE